jgi:DNA-binding transcriptional MerR regulator
MKKTELQSLINECIGEVLNEGRASKKNLAIQEIKRIIAENEIGENDLNEFDLFKSKEKKEKEASELKADKDRLTAQFDGLKDKLTNKKSTAEDALALAMRYKDNFKGEFINNKGILNYTPAKDKNPFQDRMGKRS